MSTQKEDFLSQKITWAEFPVGNNLCIMDAGDFTDRRCDSILIFTSNEEQRSNPDPKTLADLMTARRMICEKLEGLDYSIRMQNANQTDTSCNVTPPKYGDEYKPMDLVYDDVKTVCEEVSRNLNRAAREK